MKIKFFAGKWHSWGFELSLLIPGKALTVALLHWYITIEVWSRKDVLAAEQTRKMIEDMLVRYEKEQKKAKKSKKSK